MKVILLENLAKIGSIGEVIDVKRGFARNYLISNKKALYASKENIKEVEKIKSELNKKDQEKKKNAKQIYEILKNKIYEIKKLTTENKDLYGSVKPTEISKIINTHHYDREKVLDKWYDGEYISTPFDRKIEIDKRRALNYLIQSTTSDVVLERACRIDEYLKGKKSFISHIVHDEIVIDLCNEEREIVSKISRKIWY